MINFQERLDAVQELLCSEKAFFGLQTSLPRRNDSKIFRDKIRFFYIFNFIKKEILYSSKSPKEFEQILSWAHKMDRKCESNSLNEQIISRSIIMLEMLELVPSVQKAVSGKGY